ncbi:MAG: DTW domain-containing protein [Polyangiaceae bacterium]|nr:DTW domain-containing protein [Polyangiaceae bacterium]
MTEPEVHAARERCYRCHKPAQLCVCHDLEPLNNRTEIIILQHPRERFHPIGTARLAELGLRRVRRLVCWPERAFGYEGAPRFEGERPSLGPRAGLLYPSEGARDLATLALSERPEQLVVLDGTWYQARALYRDTPWLAALPHYRLDPAAPSRYRIRKEPRADYISTLEAILEALQVLEPETPGAERLLARFDRMIDDQVEHAKVRRGRAHRPRAPRPSRAVPSVLTEDYERLVVACGESSAEPRFMLPAGATPAKSQLIYWVAMRPATGERFATLVRPEQPVSDQHLGHLGLDRAALEAAPTLREALSAWRRFLRPTDFVATWNQSTWNVLREAEARLRGDPEGGSHIVSDTDEVGARSGSETDNHQVDSITDEVPFVLLKAAYYNLRRGEHRGTIEQLVALEGLTPHDTGLPGRAGARLGAALAMVELLRVGGGRAA